MSRLDLETFFFGTAICLTFSGISEFGAVNTAASNEGRVHTEKRPWGQGFRAICGFNP